MLDWTLEISIPNVSQPIHLIFDKELLLGRPDPNETIFTGLDLTPYNADQLGVSRKHAMIRNEDGYQTITDLNSGNGTYLNGFRLESGVPHNLANGDQLILGHLQMTIHTNQKPEWTAIQAKRSDLNLPNTLKKGSGQRVLIVEDDSSIAKLCQLALEKEGFTAQICREVVSAIRVLNQNTLALVILDLMLPAVHGLELCRYIRRDTSFPSLPIIVLSARSEPSLVQQTMDAGVDIYMVKPPNMKELINTVAALIQKTESKNPALYTKRLTATASLAHIDDVPHKDTVIMFIEGYREPLTAVVSSPVTLGRHKPGGGYPHIDLENQGAFEKGVSRVHAVIKRTDNEFTIEDLTSSNGTFVNGFSLREHEPRPIHNGDEIRLGGLRMHIYMLADAEQK